MNDPVITRVCGVCEQGRTTNEQKAEREPNANEQNSTLVLFAVRVRSGGK
jgi:hypothetical protein